ncbi:hypothetical protein [Metallibacterium sp.]
MDSRARLVAGAAVGIVGKRLFARGRPRRRSIKFGMAALASHGWPARSMDVPNGRMIIGIARLEMRLMGYA